MIRKSGSLDMNMVLELVREHHGRESRVEINGDTFNLASLRMQTFAFKGTVCVNCQLAGHEFFAEKHHASEPLYHLGLYSRDGILMTKDHIIPLSAKGRDHLGNLQPMCSQCNGAKGKEIWTPGKRYPIDPAYKGKPRPEWVGDIAHG